MHILICASPVFLAICTYGTRRHRIRPRKLPVKEMKRRGWLTELHLANTTAHMADYELAAKFVLEAFARSPRSLAS